MFHEDGDACCSRSTVTPLVLAGQDPTSLAPDTEIPGLKAHNPSYTTVLDFIFAIILFIRDTEVGI